MALKLTFQQINEFIDILKRHQPYNRNDKEYCVLDDERLISNGRETATLAKRILDSYFKQHPEEDVYGYLDGTCFK
ncbi:MAG: hypothetical protein K2J26_03025 [Ruminococcus sp.]|nr:hypothetical protein [Ruminococcus sp.]